MNGSMTKAVMCICMHMYRYIKDVRYIHVYVYVCMCAHTHNGVLVGHEKEGSPAICDMDGN